MVRNNLPIFHYLLFIGINFFFFKKRSNCLKHKYGKNLISVQVTCTHFKNIKRKISGFVDRLAQFIKNF